MRSGLCPAARCSTSPARTCPSKACTIRNCMAPASCCARRVFGCSRPRSKRCDVGVEVAENASDVLIERNRFVEQPRRRALRRLQPRCRRGEERVLGHKDAGSGPCAATPTRAAADQRARQPLQQGAHRHAGRQRPGADRAQRVDRLARGGDAADRAQARWCAAIASAAAPRWASSPRTRSAAIIETTSSIGLAAYGIMVKGSANTLVRGNRVHNCGYGLAFVLGDARTRAPPSRTPSSSRSSTASTSSATRRSCAVIRCCGRASRR